MRISWRGGGHALGRKEMHVELWSENLNEIIYLEDLGVDAKVIFKWILKK
jgi:hypothetical protein